MAEKQTAQEKAQAALDLVDRKLAKAKARKDKAYEAYDDASAEVKALKEEREYVAQHPALKALEVEGGEPEPDGIAKPPVDDGSLGF